jgi:hypothetical protein
MTILFHRSVIGYQERTLHPCWVISIRYWDARILTGRCYERLPLQAWPILDAAQLGLVEALAVARWTSCWTALTPGPRRSSPRARTQSE